MKSILLLCVLTVSTVLATAQKKGKVTVDDDTIKVDGKPYGIIYKQDGLVFDYTVKGLDGTELIFCQFQEFNNPNKAQPSNPNGRVTYMEITFLTSGGKCEIQAPGSKKGMAKIVVENALLNGNAVDAEAERKFILKYGTKFSDEKKSLNGPKVIIIQD